MLLLYTFGFPIFVILKLKYNADEWENDDFLSKYGFLYKAYTKDMIYWEAIIMARKAIIASIVVFAYDLGGNLQVFLVCVVLFTALSLQFICMPFSHEYPK